MTEQNPNSSQPALREQPFTEAIQAFFTDMADWPWREQLPNSMFIRDYHNLPRTSPHDIDLLIDDDEQDVFLNKVAERAAVFGLQCSIRSSKHVCFALLFDLDVSRSGRAWAFLEVRDALVITKSVSLPIDAIERETDKKTGLPVPTQPWVAFLEIFQGLRVNKLERATRFLADRDISPEAFGEIFGSLTGEKIQLPLDLTPDSEAVKNLRNLIVLKKQKPTASADLPLKTRLNRAVFKRAYYIHYAQPWLFTIHGPDGVGKSTTCNEVEKIFERLPLPLCSHHHITGWKHAKPDQKKSGAINSKTKSEGKDQQPQTGMLHAFLRWGYRLMPERLQQGYVLAQGYHHYLKNLNRLVFKEYCRGNIIFIDRYIYDLVTKNIIKDVGWNLFNRIFVRAARLPMRTYVLTDAAEKIHSRKQELTVEEIKRYEIVMASVMKRRGASIKTIDLSNRPANVIAQIIAGDMLDQCDPFIFGMFRDNR